MQFNHSVKAGDADDSDQSSKVTCQVTSCERSQTVGSNAITDLADVDSLFEYQNKILD